MANTDILDETFDPGSTLQFIRCDSGDENGTQCQCTYMGKAVLTRVTTCGKEHRHWESCFLAREAAIRRSIFSNYKVNIVLI